MYHHKALLAFAVSSREVTKLRRLTLLFALIVVLMTAHPVSAGGWAALSLIDPPTTVERNREFTLEFRVLAHNREEAPLEGIETTLLFTHKTTGYFEVAEGVPTDDPLVYEASFILEEGGEWELRAMIHNYLPTGELMWTWTEPLTVEPIV